MSTPAQTPNFIPDTPAAGPQQQPGFIPDAPATPAAPQPWYQGLATGAEIASRQMPVTLLNWAEKIPGVGPHIAAMETPEDKAFRERAAQPVQGTAQQVGKGLWDIAEFLSGDEALKGLSVAERLRKSLPMIQMLEDSPRLRVIATAARQAMVGGGQSALHGETPAQMGTAAGVAGALGAGGATAGEIINAVRPTTTELFGQEVKTLASQKPGASALARKVASIRTEPRFAQAQQLAAQQGLESHAQKVAADFLTDLNTRSGSAQIDIPAETAGIRSYGDAINVIKRNATNSFDAVNEATGGELERLQNARRAAFRAGDRAKGRAATASINDLFSQNPGLDEGDYQIAKNAWRKTYVLGRINNVIDNAINWPDQSLAADAGVWRGIRGASLNNGLKRVIKSAGGRAAVEEVIGRDGLISLTRVADLTQTPQRAAQFGQLTDEVANTLLGAITKRGIVGGTADYARRLALHGIATSPTASRAAEFVIGNRISPRIAAPIIANMLNIPPRAMAGPPPTAAVPVLPTAAPAATSDIPLPVAPVRPGGQIKGDYRGRPVTIDQNGNMIDDATGENLGPSGGTTHAGNQ